MIDMANIGWWTVNLLAKTTLVAAAAVLFLLLTRRLSPALRHGAVTVALVAMLIIPLTSWFGPAIHVSVPEALAGAASGVSEPGNPTVGEAGSEKTPDRAARTELDATAISDSSRSGRPTAGEEGAVPGGTPHPGVGAPSDDAAASLPRTAASDASSQENVDKALGGATREGVGSAAGAGWNSFSATSRLVAALQDLWTTTRADLLLIALYCIGVVFYLLRLAVAIKSRRRLLRTCVTVGHGPDSECPDTVGRLGTRPGSGRVFGLTAESGQDEAVSMVAQDHQMADVSSRSTQLRLAQIADRSVRTRCPRSRAKRPPALSRQPQAVRAPSDDTPGLPSEVHDHGILVQNEAQPVDRNTDASPLACDTLAMLDSLATRTGVRTPQLLISDQVSTPVALGWLRSRIVLPHTWRSWPQSRIEAALAHELAHFKRGDLRILLVGEVCRALYWFHPASHWICRRLAELAEEACDDLAIRWTGQQRRAYGRHLIEIVAEISGVPQTILGGLAMAQPSDLHRRINALVRTTQRRPLVLSVLISLLAGGLLLGSTGIRIAPAPSSPFQGPNPYVGKSQAQEPRSVAPESPFQEPNPFLEESPPQEPRAVEEPAREPNPYAEVALPAEPTAREETSSEAPESEPSSYQAGPHAREPMPMPQPEPMPEPVPVPMPFYQSSHEGRTRVRQRERSENQERVRDRQGEKGNRNTRWEYLTSSEVKRFVGLLGASNPAIRTGAAVHLRRGAFSRAAVPGLLPMLGDRTPIPVDPDWRERGYYWHSDEETTDPGTEAAYTLGCYGREVLPDVMSALRSGWLEARYDAILALGLIEAPETLDTLTTFLSDPEMKMRRRAVWAIGMLEDRRGLDAMVGALADRDWEVRQQAAWAVGMLEDREGVPPLVEALHDDQVEVRVKAAWGLGMIEDSSAVEGLAGAFDDASPEVRRMAVWGLGMIESDKGVPALTLALHDQQDEIRRKAAWALGMIESADAVDALGKALNDPSAEVRNTAVWAMGMIEDASAVPYLAGLAADPDAAVRKRAAWALGMIESSTAVEPLVQMLRSDSVEENRSRAAWALGMIESSKATSGLLRSLGDSSLEVRGMVVWALGMIEDHDALPALRRMSENGGEDPEIRDRARWAIRMIGK